MWNRSNRESGDIAALVVKNKELDEEQKGTSDEGGGGRERQTEPEGGGEKGRNNRFSHGLSLWREDFRLS